MSAPLAVIGSTALRAEPQFLLFWTFESWECQYPHVKNAAVAFARLVLRLHVVGTEFYDTYRR